MSRQTNNNNNNRIIREVEPEKNWEDEFKRLQEKFIAQKQLLNEQEEHIKMLHVKTRKIERAFAVLERQQGGDGTAIAKLMEDEALITNLYEKITRLEGQNTELNKKLKQMTELMEKKKKQIASMERQLNDYKRKDGRKPLSTPKDRPKTAPSTEINIVAAPTLKPAVSIDHELEAQSQAENAATNNQLLELVKTYKMRVEVAEQQLSLISADNARLRELQMRGDSTQGNDRGNNEEITSQLRDQKWKFQQLQTQYDHVSSKSAAQMEALKTAEDQLEEQTQRVRELRRVLEDLRHEKEITDMKASRVDDLEETVIELKRTNRGLEDKIARLCEAPFISDAFGQHEARLEFEKVLAERQDYVTKIDHLQEAVRTQYSALLSLKQQAAKLREEKEEAEKTCDELKARYSQLEAGTNLLQDKLRLYSGEDGVNIEDLERALTVIKRRSEVVGKLDFLENADGFQDITFPLLKKKAQEIQIINLNLTKEVERLENMLKIQTNINRDLNKELENYAHKKDKDKKELEQRAQDFEELAMKRLNKIHTLEAQLRETVYSLSKKKRSIIDGKKQLQQYNNNYYNQLDTLNENDFDAVSDVGTDNILLSELLEEKNGEIDPDENMLEVWVKGATIKDGIILPGSSTFLVIDFFDYESQTTSILPTSKPQWDFAATYKIKVDDFFLRYLATDGIIFELNLAIQGDFTLLARCKVPLQSLLRSKPLIKLEKQPMISPRTNEIIAYLQFDVRLALPVTELYRLFLERHPDEKKFIEDQATKRVIEAANQIEKAKLIENFAITTLDDESRMYNELEIVIYNIQGLPKSKDGSLPTPYVHFQLLGHPDKFTNPIQNSTDPNYNERFTFPMVTNDQQCRLLRRSQLKLSVIDMKAEEIPDNNNDNDNNEGLIGEINVSLASLAEGITIKDSFTLKDYNGDRKGVIRIALQWKHKFRTQRELGPRALTGIEVECLISSFSPGDGKEGLVEYNSFLRFIDPPISVSRAMESLQVYINQITDREGFTSREILQAITENNPRIDEDSFITFFSRLEINVLPDEWVQLFRYIDLDDNQSVSLDQILAVLNLDEVAGIPSSLHEKLTTQIRNINLKGINPKKLFQRVDQWGDKGLVTRLEFKSVLKQLGFQLVDEPDDEISSQLNFNNTNNNNNSRNNNNNNNNIDDNDLLNDTMDSDDVLLPSFATKGANVDLLKKKEIFEKKLQEFQQRTKSSLSNNNNNNNNNISQITTPRDGNKRSNIDDISTPMIQNTPDVVVGKNLLDNTNTSLSTTLNPYPDSEHRTSIGRRNNGDNMGLDKSFLDLTVTKVQSHYRGYSTRKKIRSEMSTPSSTPNKSGYSLFDQQNNKSNNKSNNNNNNNTINSLENENDSFQRKGIIYAEDVLREELSQLHGIQPTPNWLGLFLKVDSKQKNVVNRKQFAFVLGNFQSIRLPPEVLRELMDYFDSSNDGTQINYHAFCKFCNYRPLEILPAIKHLKQMVMGPNVILKFRNLDKVGTGYLSRQEMLKVLNELGYGHFSQKQALDMLSLFETRVDGHVNYSNFVEFIRDNTLSRAFDELVQKIKDLILEKGDAQENNLRRWYRRLDKENIGVISLNSFQDFLAEFDLNNYPKQVIIGVYNSLNIDGAGIPFKDFSSWIINKVDLHLPMYQTTTKAEIQKKCNTYILAILNYRETSLEELTQSYLIYDWKIPPTGFVGKGEFIRGSIHAGFPLSHAELRSLSSEFISNSDDRKVSYKKFLSWATPSSIGGGGNELQSQSIDANNIIKEMTAKTTQKRTSAILRLLEQSLERKVDLHTVFGRYDQSNSGRITPGEFGSALSDLGLSSVSQYDIIEFSDRFKAIAGDFILYRRIIAELLNQVDIRTGAAEIDILDVIKGAVSRRKGTLERLEDLFKYYDRKNMGRIREEDIGTIFEESGIKLSRQELEKFADKFSIGPSGWIQYSAFLSALNNRLGKGITSQISKAVNGLPDDIANKISWLLETLILKGIDFRAELDTYDDRFTGAILQSDFRDVLQEKFRAGLTSKDLEILERVYRDKSDPRKVNFVKILQELHPRNLKGITPEIMTLLDIAEDLRTKIRKRTDYLTPGELKRPFRHFARKRIDSGFSVEELGIGMKDLGIIVTGDQVKDLFKMINLDGGKTIKLNNFVVFVCDPHHDDIIWKLRRGIRRARVSDAEIMESIEEQDSNDSGFITSKQFMKSLKSLNIDMSEQDLLRLMLRFDNDEAQRFDISLFRSFLIGTNETEDDKLKKSIRRTSRDDENILDSPNRTNSNRLSAEATETRVMNALRDRIMDQFDIGLTHNEIFSMFDESNKGSIDLVSLMQGGRELGISMTRAEGRNVLRRLSLLAGGIVDKVSFFDALDINIKKLKKKGRFNVNEEDDYIDSRKPKGDNYSNNNDDNNDDNDNEPPLAIIRILTTLRKELNLNESDDGIKSLRRALQDQDNDRDGYINRKEFSRALSSLDLNINTRDIIRLFEYLDSINLGDGAVKLATIIAFVGRRMKQREEPRSPREQNRTKADAAAITFRKQPHLLEELTIMASDLSKRGRQLKNLLQDFRDVDVKNTGEVNRAEFCDRLRMFGFNLKQDFERNLCDSLLSVNESNMIDYVGFIKALQLSLSQDEDLDDILKSLRKNIQAKLSSGKDLSDIFDAMDNNGNGKISVDELKEGLKKIGISISRDEVSRVIDKFSQGGFIRYRDFVRVLAPHGRSEEDYVMYLVERIRTSLKDRFGSESLSIQRVKSVFADIDSNGDGLLSIREFGNGMAALKVDLENDDIKKIFSAFDVDGIGKLKYKDFIDLLGGVKSLERKGDKNSKNDTKTNSRRDEPDVEDILEIIRKRMEDTLGTGGNITRKIKQSFEDADLNNDRSVDKREFKKVMNALGVNISGDEIAAVFNKFDRNGDGGLNYAEFLKLTGFDKLSSRDNDRDRNDRDDRGKKRSDSDDILELVRQKLEESLGRGGNITRKIREAFEDADLNNDRSVDMREFKKVMLALGVNLSGDEIKSVYDKFDRNGDGGLNYAEFLKLTGFDKVSSRDNDRDRDRNDRDDRGKKRSDSDDVEDILVIIRKKMEDTLGTGGNITRRVREAFEDADLNNDRSVDKREFKKVMNALGVNISGDEIAAVFNKFDRNGDGGLNYAEFLKLTGFDKLSSRDNDRDRNDRNDRNDRDDRGKKRANSDDVEDILVIIRKRMEDTLGTGGNITRRIREAFEDADLNNDRSVDKREFKKVMNALGIDFSLEEIKAVFNKFDRNGDGGLNYAEFLKLTGFDKVNDRDRNDRNDRNDRDDRGKKRSDSDDVEDILDVIRKKIEESLGRGGNINKKVREAFEDADLNNDRSVDMREFKKVMLALGVNLTLDEIKSVYSKFDRNGDGGLNYTEFLKLTGFDKVVSETTPSGSGASSSTRSSAGGARQMRRL